RGRGDRGGGDRACVRLSRCAADARGAEGCAAAVRCQPREAVAAADGGHRRGGEEGLLRDGAGIMGTSITMPALSPTMEEGNLAKWHVKVGDKIKPGDIIAEIETDKATMEVEAVDEG